MALLRRFMALLSVALGAMVLGANDIPTRTLSTGVEMPVISLGCGSGLIGKNVTGAVSSWITAGATGIDAAHIYSWSVGNGKIADGISAAGKPRSDLFITSKTFCSRQAAKDVKADIKNLGGIGHLDLLLIHSPHHCGLFANICDTWKTYTQLLEAGTARAIGVSNFQVKDLEALQACSNVTPTVNQISFSVGMYKSYTSLMAYMAMNNITLEAFSPLQKGAVLKIPAVIKIAAAHNVSAAQVSLKWILQHGAVLTTSVDGSKSPEYLKEDLDLWSFELSDEDMKTLDAVDSVTDNAMGNHPVANDAASTERDLDPIPCGLRHDPCSDEAPCCIRNRYQFPIGTCCPPDRCVMKPGPGGGNRVCLPPPAPESVTAANHSHG